MTHLNCSRRFTHLSSWTHLTRTHVHTLMTARNFAISTLHPPTMISMISSVSQLRHLHNHQRSPTSCSHNNLSARTTITTQQGTCRDCIPKESVALSFGSCSNFQRKVCCRGKKNPCIRAAMSSPCVPYVISRHMVYHAIRRFAPHITGSKRASDCGVVHASAIRDGAAQPRVCTPAPQFFFFR